MAKQGMKHYYTRHEQKDVPQVPEISGKAKSGKEKARNLIAGENGKVYHITPHEAQQKVSDPFPAMDNELAIENLCSDFDMTDADLQDLQQRKPN